MGTRSLETRLRADIDALKASWREDPSWDIEETEGFEAHKAELLRYRVEVEAERDRRGVLEHAEAVRKITAPARVILAGEGIPETGRLLGELAMKIAAEMLLPLQRQIDRQAEDIEAMQRRHEDEIDALKRKLRDR
jgi:hypothetical protein